MFLSEQRGFCLFCLLLGWIEIWINSYCTVLCENRFLGIGNWSPSDNSYELLLTKFLTVALHKIISFYFLRKLYLTSYFSNKCQYYFGVIIHFHVNYVFKLIPGTDLLLAVNMKKQNWQKELQSIRDLL